MALLLCITLLPFRVQPLMALVVSLHRARKPPVGASRGGLPQLLAPHPSLFLLPPAGRPAPHTLTPQHRRWCRSPRSLPIIAPAHGHAARCGPLLRDRTCVPTQEPVTRRSALSQPGSSLAGLRPAFLWGKRVFRKCFKGEITKRSPGVRSKAGEAGLWGWTDTGGDLRRRKKWTEGRQAAAGRAPVPTPTLSGG